MKYCKKSINEACDNNRDIVKTIYSKMLSEHPRADLKYKPFTKLKEMDIVLKPGVDFSNYFSDFEDGDYAFIASGMDGTFERDMIYSVSGCADAEVYFNGERQPLTRFDENTLDANIRLKSGANKVIIKVTAKDGVMKATTRPLIPALRCTPDDYIYNTRQYQTNDGYIGQEGISLSRLYRKDEAMPSVFPDEIEWTYPVKPVQTKEKTFDFNNLCKKGIAAYAYTHIKGKIVIEHKSPLKIFSGQEVLYNENEGVYSNTFNESTPILIKSAKYDKEWGFTVTDAQHTSLPFAEHDECEDLTWLWVGPFGRESENIQRPYAPEINLTFHVPFPSISGVGVYWRFYRENTYLWQYLQSPFFGQWSYSMMVAMNALSSAADKLGDTEFYSYFMDSMAYLCKHRDFAKISRDEFGWSSYLPKGAWLKDLDSIGTIGMNIAEYYIMTGDVNAKYMLSLLASSLMQNIPRFPDGTFHRTKTMWTDDMYMCLPFITRLAVITGEKKFYDEILTQVTGYYNRMFMPEEGIYSHIYYPEEGDANKIPWCRGNGWVLLALSEVLQHTDDEWDGRGKILEIFRTFAKGVIAFRDKEEGIWHQVLNRPDSYIETSGSGMFIIGLSRGVANGWLPEEYKEEILAAWKSLTDKCVDEEGNVYGVCMGSNCNRNVEYYMALKTIINDDHGTGIVLNAGVSVMNMLGEI